MSQTYSKLKRLYNFYFQCWTRLSWKPGQRAHISLRISKCRYGQTCLKSTSEFLGLLRTSLKSSSFKLYKWVQFSCRFSSRPVDETCQEEHVSDYPQYSVFLNRLPPVLHMTIWCEMSQINSLIETTSFILLDSRSSTFFYNFKMPICKTCLKLISFFFFWIFKTDFKLCQ